MAIYFSHPSNTFDSRPNFSSLEDINISLSFATKKAYPSCAIVNESSTKFQQHFQQHNGPI
ncbi:hypothetical protein CPAR01_09071 [Colletotrichum paranaense]|uniref:Uncharacterized protein n=1 Tax=Colletotrichum paranaense TaxID=1914294 RepID=A0ABQ9SGW5_9PEZI|nr:uncharacterized protein CPAR01_09071 [Colletotrichum paranaense]KAK1535529.1 hypothetical protein CPAR01_09071 [Colletotrichum paranaense]